MNVFILALIIILAIAFAACWYVIAINIEAQEEDYNEHD